MKKKITAIILVVMMLAVSMMLSGCFNKLLYGTWRLSYVANEFGENRTQYPYVVTWDIRENGDIYMLAGNQQSHFANIKFNKNLFTMTYVNPSSTGASTVSGSWIMVQGDEATEMHLYFDEEPKSYILQRTTPTGVIE